MTPELGPYLGDDYLDCLRYAIKNAAPGRALEFGVASGRTLRMIAEKMPVIGFDSFEGLPVDWREGFPKGAFSCSIPDVPNSEIVAGLFEDTLPKYFEGLEDVCLVHIDCDLYSSTVTVLENIGSKLLSGTLIVFDEYHGYPGWESHEHKAWTEFVSKNCVEFEVLGHGPEQLVVRLT